MAQTTQVRQFDLEWRAASGGVVPAVLSTETPVVRSFGNEILRHDPASINFERFPLPVIVSHDQRTISIAVAENPRTESGKLRADVRFGSRSEAQEYLKDVESGVIRSLSVGYYIDQYEERGDDYIVTRWTPHEVSLVSCPADVGAGFYRSSQHGVAMEGDLTTVNSVNTEKDPAAVAAATVLDGANISSGVATSSRTFDLQATMLDDAKIVERAIAAERDRVTGIRKAARAARLDDAFADDLIERGVALADAREAIHQKWSSGPVAIPTGHVTITRDERQTKREGIVDALLFRMGVGEMSDNGRQFYGDTFLDMMQSIEKRQIGESRAMYAQRVMSTSDMPNILSNVANKSLLKAYTEAPKTFEPFVTRQQVTDFKTNTVTNTSNYPGLIETAELIDYPEGSVTDKKETFSVKSYGRVLQFSRQMMINDDLGALQRMLTTSGAAVARLESDLVYGVLTANAAMADTVALFANGHGNLGTGGAISDSTLAEAFLKFRKQTGIGGEQLNLTPKYLVAPAALENTILKQMSAIYAATVANQNIYVSALTPIIEPRLDTASATAWYLIGSPMAADTIWLASLSGVAPIITEEKYDFDNGAWKIKVVADRGVAAIDHRNMFKNAGA